MKRALTHDEALDCIVGAAGVTVLSYQEAIESYLMLRRHEHLFTSASGMDARQGGNEVPPRSGDSPVDAKGSETPK